MFACDALAKIKDGSSVDSLVKAANDADPNVRTSAIQALGAFAGGSGAPSEAAKGAIAEALRDSYPKARIAACQAAAAGKVAEALPFLRYKAQSDPEQVGAERGLPLPRRPRGGSIGSASDGLDDPFVFLRAGSKIRRKMTIPQGASASGFSVATTRPDPCLRSRRGSKPRPPRRTGPFIRHSLAKSRTPTRPPASGPSRACCLSDKEYLIRIAAIEWIRKNKASDLKPDLERLAKDDPSDMIKKRAAEALKSF